MIPNEAASMSLRALAPHPILRGLSVVLADESRYASGSHKEPAARAVVEQAVADGHDWIVVGSCGNYGKAMAMACMEAGIRCTVVLPAHWHHGGAFAETADVEIRLIEGGYEEAVAEAHRIADDEGGVDGNVNGLYTDAVLEGHGQVIQALHESISGEPSSLWLPIGNGTTAVAAQRRLRTLSWHVPLHGVGSPGNNPIVTSWPGVYRPLASDAVVTTESNEPLVNWHSLHGPESMAAIAESGGSVHGADDDQLVDAQGLLARSGIRSSPAGAAGLAGLLAHAQGSDLLGHQIVLVTGR